MSMRGWWSWHARWMQPSNSAFPRSEAMQIGMVGLGKMGGNMSRRLMKAGHRCVVYARSANAREALAKDGATATASLADLVRALKEKPRVVWFLLPSGDAHEETVES